VHVLQAAPSSAHWKDPGSLVVNAKVASVAVEDEPSAGPEVIVVSGGVVSPGGGGGGGGGAPEPSSSVAPSTSNDSPLTPVA
jgi:hypothetical protein